MAQTRTTWRERLDAFGIIGAIGVAIVAAGVYYAVHEVFHLLLGTGPVIDTVGSVALGGVAAVGVFALGGNLRVVAAAFIGLFVTHSLVMGYGGALVFSNMNWSVPVAVVAAVVFFLAAGGLAE